MLEDPRVKGFLWIVVMRRRRPRLKLWAAAVEVTTLIVLGIDLGQTHRGRFVPDTYETTAVGPAKREATPSVTREFPYPVNAGETGRQHLLEFTPVVRSPNGQIAHSSNRAMLATTPCYSRFPSLPAESRLGYAC